MNYVVIIPARYESSRLPGKPLINLCGIPMVVRTYRQCIKACPSEKVFVATDDQRIKEICEQYGIQVLITSNECLTGTDRVAECMKQIDADIYINVQGDEPVFDPTDIVTLIEMSEMYPGEILNGVCELDYESQYWSQNIPKVVMRPDGRLLYMSRAAIPFSKSCQFIRGWRQVCAYAFPRGALQAFTGVNKKTPLEQIEDIEILRFLELGWDVRMVMLSGQSVAVDTSEDVERVKKIIKQRGL